MKAYIDQNRERFFEELFSLLRIPSISAKPEYKPDMYRCARRLTELLTAAGADKAAVYETAGNPVVFGSKAVPGAKKTVLVYGHYDVQPPEPLDKWRTRPFEPVIAKDPATGEEAIYARGANDDKGQLFMHLKAFEYLLKKGLLRHNVKFIFEGEEEIGSPSLAAWAEEHKDLLKADIILVSDTTMISEKVPSINCGMRGLSYLEVTVTGPNKDLHSGHYGGAVANPINTLCAMIASLHDADGRITVPGFYDDVVELSAEDRAMLARAPFDMDEYKAPPVPGRLRHLGRLHRRRREDRPPLHGPRQDLHAPGPEPDLRKDHRTLREPLPRHRPEICEGRCQTLRRRQRLPHPHHLRRLQGRLEGHGRGLWH